MSGNSGKLMASQQCPPGGQAYFHLTYVPNAVNVQNSDQNLDGSCVTAWLYPNTSPAVENAYTVVSEGAQTVRPPPADGNGVNVAALVVFNTGQAPLNIQPH